MNDPHFLTSHHLSLHPLTYAVLDPYPLTYAVLDPYPGLTDDSYIDLDEARSGSLLSDMHPPVSPPDTISDPDDRKPAAWVDAAQVPDPLASKVSTYVRACVRGCAF